MLKKVNYIDSISLEDALPKATREFMNNNPHNNGWCYIFDVVKDMSKTEYPDYVCEINEYFLEQGMKPNSKVYIHYHW